jgi:purine nucleosidase
LLKYIPIFAVLIQGNIIYGVMTNLAKSVFFDHDGSIDDLAALIVLLRNKNFRINGISITDGAGDGAYTAGLTLKLINRFARYPISVAKSSVKPINPFPANWRSYSGVMAAMPLFFDDTNEQGKESPFDGPDFLAKTLLDHPFESMVLLTGPASNLIAALEKNPGLEKKISKVIWMAGALFCDGNVVAPDHDGSAEWNIYWDPVSAQKLIKWGLNLFLVPIDICHEVPADRYFIHRLSECNHAVACQWVYQMLAPRVGQHKQLFLFDLVAAACLCKPEMAKVDQVKIDIEQRGTSAGNMYRSEQGSLINYFCSIDEEMFYNFVINALER